MCVPMTQDDLDVLMNKCVSARTDYKLSPDPVCLERLFIALSEATQAVRDLQAEIRL